MTDRKHLDALWFKALDESVKDGEMYIRYHFAALVISEKDAENASLKEAAATWNKRYREKCQSAADDLAIRGEKIVTLEAENERLREKLACSKAREEAYRAEVVALSGELATKDKPKT